MLDIPKFKLQKGAIIDDMIKDRSRSPETIKPSTAQISGLEEAFIEDIKKCPDSGVAARYKRLGLSARKGDQMKKDLLEKGVVEEVEKKTEKGRVKVLFF